MSQSALTSALALKADHSDFSDSMATVNGALLSQASSIGGLQTSVATCVHTSDLATALQPLVSQTLLSATVAPLATSAALSTGLAAKANSSDVQAALALKADSSLVAAQLQSYTKTSDFAPVQAAQAAATNWIASSGATQAYVQGIQATLQAEINNCPTMTSVVTAIEGITSSLTNSGGGGNANTVTTQDAQVALPFENAGGSYKILLTSSSGTGPNELQAWKRWRPSLATPPITWP